MSVVQSIVKPISQSLARSVGVGPSQAFLILGSLAVSDSSPADGDTVTISFTESPVSGDSLTYQWTRDGVNLSNGGDISGATSSQLSIANFEAADSGVYRLVVVNAAISASRTFTVGSITVPAISDFFSFFTNWFEEVTA